MMESTADVLQRLWRDNDEDARRHENIATPVAQGYRNGLDAANARIRATLAGRGGASLRSAAAGPEPERAPYIDADPIDETSFTAQRLPSAE